MKRASLFLLITFGILHSEYITGDVINDISFQDSDVDSSMSIFYTQKSTKELISSGRIVVISFFGPG